MAITYPVPSSSSASSAFPISTPSPSASASWAPFVITQKEINAFHNIDRTLYNRLVIHLHRNPVGSMHVMALWIWFERLGCHKGNLVNLLLGFPDSMINVLADEAVMCLMCIECEDFPPENDQQQIPMTQSLTGAPLSVRFFYENRAEIGPAILKIVNDVCLKAFPDIMQEAMRLQTSNRPSNHNNYFANNKPNTNFHVPNPNPNTHFQFSSLNPHSNFHFPNPNLGPNFNVPNPSPSTNFHVPNPSPRSGFFTSNPRDTPPRAAPSPSYNNRQVNLPLPFPCFTNPTMPPTSSGGATSSSSNVAQVGAPPFVKEGGFLDLLTKPSHEYELEDHREFLDDEITEVLNRLHLEVFDASGGDQERALCEEVPQDERTIFLTFSKGYPLSENEVRDFFTRRYGNCFEAIHMQEVSPSEQALYARLVVRSASSIDVVLNGRSKAKFSINGKHVWARKYVRKVSKSPPGPSPSPPLSQSPVSPSHMIRAPSRNPYVPIQFGNI
ncbi:uncharacterized protein LOC116195259 [Punica granatum]|uniref:RRM domain-containing protein n=2 Tax=Punica granatum TaxID=22663 RepID=A0A218WB96_PUNGR|nr:uncharacterized protein LOC116195259 [Punica granatum]OWM70147.1 hypothetical protein CDL15_Pgr025997 [Punica granatum]PKI43283.1 hypothetical protein CRG98_036369 [Punica granatum]